MIKLECTMSSTVAQSVKDEAKIELKITIWVCLNPLTSTCMRRNQLHGYGRSQTKMAIL